jgi:hypothetical protein
MSKVAITGNASGTGVFTIASPNSNSDRTLNLPDGDGAMPLMKLETAVTASGTAVDFTGIPAWVKRITVMFSGVSLSGTSLIQVQLGDAGGIENTGYLGSCNTFDTSPSANNYSSGFLAIENPSAAFLTHGLMTLANVSGNLWAESHSLGLTGATAVSVGGGSKTLSDTLTQVRITTVNGTNTFDAGTINIMYEG